MGRSQRRMILTQGYNAAGAALDEGAVAPGLLMQVDDPPQQFDLKVVEGVEVPFGPEGGPLQGSTLTGGLPSDLVIDEGTPPTYPPPTEVAIVSMLDPTEATIGDPTDITLHVVGSGYTPESIVLFNHGEEQTVFLSEQELTTIVKPSTAGTAGAYPVQVRNIIGDSNPVDFTFHPVDAPAPGDEFRIVSLNPASIPAGMPDLTVEVRGLGFEDGAVIIFGGTDMATSFLSETEVHFICDVSEQPVGEVPIAVRNPGGETTAEVPMTFTAGTKSAKRTKKTIKVSKK